MGVSSTLPVGERFWILGAGVTGLAASWVSGLPALEAASLPGGICRSYFAQSSGRPGSYRFETGGGHWIFGGDPVLTAFLEGFGPLRRYQRKSSVYFAGTGQYVPYPLQYNLRCLDPKVARQALAEMTAADPGGARTFAEWLKRTFGETLNRIFFEPFHDLYTAGLLHQIAPQDSYKTPVDLQQVESGMRSAPRPSGYNHTFLYPERGLGRLVDSIAAAGRVHCGTPVVSVDANPREIWLGSGARLPYDALLSTLPLDVMLRLTGIELDETPDPSTAVLVLNIGGVRGPRCPDDHWLYVPNSQSGFHRVGFYSNVDTSFLPEPSGNLVSLYVERAFRTDAPPTQYDIDEYAKGVVGELTDWGFLDSVDVVDPNWIPVAYTWSRPGSRWRGKAIDALRERGIYMTGRYGKWHFQGIADSLRDGLLSGSALRSLVARGSSGS